MVYLIYNSGRDLTDAQRVYRLHLRQVISHKYCFSQLSFKKCRGAVGLKHHQDAPSGWLSTKPPALPITQPILLRRCWGHTWTACVSQKWVSSVFHGQSAQDFPQEVTLHSS